MSDEYDSTQNCMFTIKSGYKIFINCSFCLGKVLHPTVWSSGGNLFGPFRYQIKFNWWCGNCFKICYIRILIFTEDVSKSISGVLWETEATEHTSFRNKPPNQLLPLLFFFSRWNSTLILFLNSNILKESNWLEIKSNSWIELLIIIGK